MSRLPPPRCFSCGRATASLCEQLEVLLRNNLTCDEAMKQLGCTQMCCRRMLLSRPIRDLNQALLHQHYVSQSRLQSWCPPSEVKQGNQREVLTHGAGRRFAQ
jgi:DNA-directed RNA polymerase subunit N (RpoN/RPB10)